MINWSQLRRKMSSILIHITCSCFIRIGLILYGFIHDQIFQVKYTDVDYRVFTDGSVYMSEGRSPFLRDGYRYSPVFAFLLIPNVILFQVFGKILFSVFDVLTGWYIHRLLTRCKVSDSVAIQCAMMWLYNPLPLIVSTRGSSDSIVTWLIIAMVLLLVDDKMKSAGLMLGIVCHIKIFPVVYVPIIYLYLRNDINCPFWSWDLWNPFTKRRMEFFSLLVISFSLLTGYSYHLYGKRYLDEAWLYHIKRKDLQHNFSIYFYLYKLIPVSGHHLLSGAAFIPQVSSLMWTSKKVIDCKSRDEISSVLFLSLFIQTFLFVSLNKVITSQYFLWYLCLFPLIVPNLSLNSSDYLKMFSLWFSSQLLWLLPAYLYEFQRVESCLFWTWIASIIFLFVNISIIFRISNSFNSVTVCKQE